MKKAGVFNHVTVDGFFAGPNGETDWFYNMKQDDEWDSYTRKASESGSVMLFGRTTYEMMKSYWPTADALKADPKMADVLNNGQKIVFSKTLPSQQEGANWKNVTVLKEINREEILKLKEKHSLTILGSGSIVQQLANMGLIDEYMLVVVPVVLGKGKSLFKDVKRTEFELLESKSFKNEIVMLRYKPKN